MKASLPIPPRIIQTGRSRDLPPLARAAAKTLQLLHPDWEFQFFDDDDVRRFIAAEFPQYRTAFDGFPHRIQRYDFFRYLAIYRLGGFYLDLDVLLWAELDPLRSHSCVFPFEELTLNRFLRGEYGVDWEVGNYAFGAGAGHPFLAAVVENCLRAQHDRQWLAPMTQGIPVPFRPRFEVFNTTGPGLVTRTLAELGQGADVVVLCPGDVCDTRNWHRFGNHGIHLMEGSWHPRGNVLWRKAALRWESWTRRRLLKQSQALGPTRQLPIPLSA